MRAVSPDQQCRNQQNDDQHEQRGVGEIDLMTADGKQRRNLWIWNWWIGSTVMVLIAARNLPSLFRSPEPCRHRVLARDHSGGAHHIEHARDEAEQKKYDKPPGRDAEQPVDQPAEAGADQHACNEFAREPEAPGVARCSRGPIPTRTIRRPACTTRAWPRPSPDAGVSRRGRLHCFAACLGCHSRAASLIFRHSRLAAIETGPPLKPRGPY